VRIYGLEVLAILQVLSYLSGNLLRGRQPVLGRLDVRAELLEVDGQGQ
jgi:hypothetical protein